VAGGRASTVEVSPIWVIFPKGDAVKTADVVKNAGAGQNEGARLFSLDHLRVNTTPFDKRAGPLWAVPFLLNEGLVIPIAVDGTTSKRTPKVPITYPQISPLPFRNTKASQQSGRDA
jgi:hypothetical protein